MIELSFKTNVFGSISLSKENLHWFTVLFINAKLILMFILFFKSTAGLICKKHWASFAEKKVAEYS